MKTITLNNLLAAVIVTAVLIFAVCAYVHIAHCIANGTINMNSKY